MKSRLFWKIMIILPLLMFLDYILMALLGCTSCLLGMGEDYYCGKYCLFGKIILLLSVILFFRIIFNDLRVFFKATENGQTAEEKNSK